MIYGVLAYVQQFYNWLTTGNNMTPPEMPVAPRLYVPRWCT